MKDDGKVLETREMSYAQGKMSFFSLLFIDLYLVFIEKANYLKRKNVASAFSLGEPWQAADQAHTSEFLFLHSERAEPK